MSEVVKSKRSVLRFFRWYDYVVVVLNVAAVIMNLVVGDWSDAISSAVITFLYVGFIGFSGAYLELLRERNDR